MRKGGNLVLIRILAVILVAATVALAAHAGMWGQGAPIIGGGSSSPSGIACDIGPNYTGPIPAAASAAGYTRCAANYDFTNAAYSNLANWLSCSGTYNPATPQWWLSGSVTAPCSDFAMVSDGALSQVFRLEFTTADYNNNVRQTQIGTTTNVIGSTTGQISPPGRYDEVVFRIDNTAYTSNPLLSSGSYMPMYDFFVIGATPGNFNNISTTTFPELDWNEGYAHSGPSFQAGATFAEWGPSPCGSRCFGNGGSLTLPTTVPTSYITSGGRYTQNASTGAIGVCMYQDAGNPIATSARTQVSCNTGSWQNGASDASINSRLLTLIYTGNQQAAGTNTCGGGSSSCAPTNPYFTYIQRWTIWVCPAGNSTTNGCATGVDVGTP
jgi:hypothetical protein